MTIVHPDYPAWAGSPAYRDESSISDFIVHHSDGSPDQTPLEIDHEHRAEGWCGIGYTWVIGKDGTVYQGRPVGMVPSAAYGRNEQSVDVCLLGDFQPGTAGYVGAPTVAQVQSLKELSVYAHQKIPTLERIIGHRDVATLFYPSDPGDYATACPGDALEALLAEVRAYTAAQLA